MATRTPPKRDRQKLLNLLSLMGVEMGIILGAIFSLSDTDPELAEFEANLYIVKTRVIEVWEDWQNHVTDDEEQSIARRARLRCRQILQSPLSPKEKIEKLAVAYTLAFMKRDRVYRMVERPIKVTRYEPNGDAPICRYYWKDGTAELNGKPNGKKRICRAPIATLDLLQEAIADGDSAKMLNEIRQTGQREIMVWVQTFSQFVQGWLEQD